MSGILPQSITRDGAEVGTLYEMRWHGKVCLHSEDPDLVDLLVREGLVAPRRPPFLDAAHDGVHGAYRPRPQINLFFDPPATEILQTIRPALEEAGYAILPEASPATS